MAATDTGYAKGDYLRICDTCLHRFHFSDLTPIGELRFACADDAKGLTAMQISRWNARARPLVVKPNRWAKGLTQTPTYQLSEASVFDYLLSLPAPFVSAQNSAPSNAAWAGVYMGELLAQGLRPPVWLASAKAALRRLCDYLLTLQFTTTASDPRYGGILDVSYATRGTIAAGIAFVRAYQALGDTKYIGAADRVATFLRRTQCGDLQSANNTAFPGGSGRYHVGGVGVSVAAGGGAGAMTSDFLVGDISAAWFLSVLTEVYPATTVYGDSTATAFFVSATAASIATMTSELVTFAAVGARDGNSGGNLVVGLSTTKMSRRYVAATSGGGVGQWLYNGVTSDELGLAIRGLFQVSGVTTQVSSLLAWLAAFTPNPANATPTQPASVTMGGIAGTYDPTLCPANNMAFQAPFVEDLAALYSWSSLGLLAPALSASNMSGFARSKNRLDKAVRFSTTEIGTKYLGPLGVSGLGLQPNNTSGAAPPDPTFAAKAGLAYRSPPGNYPRQALF